MVTLDLHFTLNQDGEVHNQILYFPADLCLRQKSSFESISLLPLLPGNPSPLIPLFNRQFLLLDHNIPLLLRQIQSLFIPLPQHEVHLFPASLHWARKSCFLLILSLEFPVYDFIPSILVAREGLVVIFQYFLEVVADLFLKIYLADCTAEGVGLWFFVADEGGDLGGDEEGDFADAFYMRTREVGEKFVFGRWWVVVLWYLARRGRRRSWVLQVLGRLGKICFYGGDAGSIVCDGAIEVVEGFVAGLEVQF